MVCSGEVSLDGLTVSRDFDSREITKRQSEKREVCSLPRSQAALWLTTDIAYRVDGVFLTVRSVHILKRSLAWSPTWSFPKSIYHPSFLPPHAATRLFGLFYFPVLVRTGRRDLPVPTSTCFLITRMNATVLHLNFRGPSSPVSRPSDRQSHRLALRTLCCLDLPKAD